MLSVSAAPTPALDAIDLVLDGAAGPAWRSGPIEIALSWGADGLASIDAAVAALRLPAPFGEVRRVALRCAAARVEAQQVRCDAMTLELALRGGPRLTLRGALRADPARGRLDVDLPLQRTAIGRLGAALQFDGSLLDLRLELEGTALAELSRALRADASMLAASAGRVTGSLRFTRRKAGSRIELDAGFSDLAFSDEVGSRAGEGLGGRLRLSARQRGGGWGGSAALALTAGVAYVAPLLLDAGDAPVSVRVGALRYQAPRLSLDDAEVRLGGALAAQGGVQLDLTTAPGIERVALTMPRAPMAELYRLLLQPFFPTGLLSALTLQGHAQMTVDWSRAGTSSARLTLERVAAGDADGRFAVLGVDADLHWGAGIEPAESSLRVEQAQLGRLELGAFRLRLLARDDALVATSDMRVPILDGAVRVARLEASGLGGDLRVEMDAEVEPLSMRALSERMAWLPLSGTLAGRIPALVYARERLAVGGELLLSLFDGSVRISGLSVLHPFREAPEVRGDLTLENLSLQQLSSAMSFGSIEGRLSGYVRGLVTEGLRPVAFDAFLATPEDDRSRHRISQRAVDNLASLGGANAALSSTFLRFFETFSYDRLGLGCRLQAGVCSMRGVAPARRGYYIVKGGGLPPRVDVVGYNTRVDWETLLQRLRAVASSPGPVVR
jgi:hypothetical protein